MTETTPKGEGAPSSTTLNLMATLMVLGIGLSSYLSWVHLQVTYAEVTVGGLCNLSRRVNCNVAAGSGWSEIAGIPIAILGLGFYLAVLASLLIWRSRGFANRWLPEVWRLAFGGAVLYSLLLGGISSFVLRSFCWACVSLYVVNFVALYAVWRMERPGLGGLLKHLPEALLSPSGAALGLGFVLTVGALTPASGLYGEHLLEGRDARRAEKAAAWLKNKYLTQEPVPEAQWRRFQSGPARGADEGAPIVMVEFSDFECPFCRRLSPVIEAMIEEHPGQIRVVFHHYPLDQACNPKIGRAFHPLACEASRAAICAERQGRFWEMHDALFEGEVDAASARGYAERLGLDVAAWDACLESPATTSALHKDMEMMWSTGQQGTPLLYINGRQAGGAIPDWLMRVAIAHELEAAK